MQSIILSGLFDSLFLPSKYPVFLGLYSNGKFIIILILIILFLLSFLLYRSRIPTINNASKSVDILLGFCPYKVFFILSVLLFIPSMVSDIRLSGDITIQLTAALHKFNGCTNSYNNWLTINPNDWSRNNFIFLTWWPPFSLYSLHTLLSSGLSLGNSLKIMICLCYLIGGLGFIASFKKIGFSRTTILIFAVFISFYCYTRDGLNSLIVMTFDFIGFAFFPWIIYFTFSYLQSFKNSSLEKRGIVCLFLLFLSMGSMYYVKNTWFLYASALSAFTCLHISFKFLQSRKILNGLFLISLATAAFFIPVIVLEYQNYTSSGISTLTGAIKENFGASWYNDVYGENYTKSTNGWQFIASILASPGFFSFGHKFFINGSYYMTNLDWIKDLVNQLDNELNYIIFNYIFYGFIANIALLYIFVKYQSLLPSKYLFFLVIIFTVSISLFATNTYLHKTANSLLNFDSRYRILTNVLIEIAILEIIVKSKILFKPMQRIALVIPFVLVVFSYPLLEGTIVAITSLHKSFQKKCETVNGITGSCSSIFSVSELLLKHQKLNQTVFIYYSKDLNIAPFNFAEKTVFINNQKQLDSLFKNYESSTNLRILLISNNMPKIDSARWQVWQRHLNADNSWFHENIKSSRYRFTYIDSGKTII